MEQALLEDTIEAVAASSSVAHVVVVSPDGITRSIAERAGAEWMDDAGAPGLNAAIGAGLACHRRRGRWPVAVVLGDLPFIDPLDLDQVLLRSVSDPGSPVFVPDAEGLGTTILAAADPDLMAPGFGRWSASRHRSAGYRELTDAPSSVRRDVDNLVDLAEGAESAPRTRTAALVGALRARGRWPGFAQDLCEGRPASTLFSSENR